jgi:5-methylthioribose kinase
MTTTNTMAIKKTTATLMENDMTVKDSMREYLVDMVENTPLVFSDIQQLFAEKFSDQDTAFVSDVFVETMDELLGYV